MTDGEFNFHFDKDIIGIVAVPEGVFAVVSYSSSDDLFCLKPVKMSFKDLSHEKIIQVQNKVAEALRIKREKGEIVL